MAASSMESKGFFSNLFDFHFDSFITLRFMRWIYALLVVLICLVGFLFFVTGLASGRTSGVLLSFTLVPAMTLLYLVFARVSMEMVAIFFRIGENTSLMASALREPPTASGVGPRTQEL